MSTTQANDLVIPEALSDEDGERWFLQGHVEPPMAVLAVLLEQMLNVGAGEAKYIFLGSEYLYDDAGEKRPRSYGEQIEWANDLLGSVSHYWLKPDPADDERMLPCAEGDDGAEPWTEVRA